MSLHVIKLERKTNLYTKCGIDVKCTLNSFLIKI